MSARRQHDPAVIALFSEIVMVETLARSRLTRVLPRGMELSHFMVLNHFARLGGEKTPAQLARVFHVTKGRDDQHRRRGSTRPATSTSAPTGRTAGASGCRSAPPGGRPRPRRRRRSRRSSTTSSAALGIERMRGALPMLRRLRELLDPD